MSLNDQSDCFNIPQYLPAQQWKHVIFTTYCAIVWKESVYMAPLTIESSVFLNDHKPIPLLGLGAYASLTSLQACLTAFQQGYRSVDTAQLYGNKAECGMSSK